MFNKIHIIYDSEGNSQLFVSLSGGSENFNMIKDGIVVRDYNASLVLSMNKGKSILKLIKPRSFHEYFKMLWGASRAHKEYIGNLLLKSLGISVPEIISHGYGYIPSAKYRFIGFINMENLNNKGFDDAREVMEKTVPGDLLRRMILDNFLSDVRKMRDKRIVFNDLKLGNIFSDEKGSLMWIDTGVSSYPWYQARKFKTKHNFSVQRFISRHEQLLTDDEKACIRKLLVG